MNEAGIFREYRELLPVSLTLRFLGPPQLQRAVQPLPLPRTRKALALLALLALHAGRSVDRKYLAEVLWPESDPATGATNLRQALAILRRSLGEDAEAVIAEGKQALRLELGPLFCDVAALDNALQRRDTDATKALYTGPFLEGFTDDWVLVEREKREAAVRALLTPTSSARLPAFLTPFLGRTQERSRLTELLQREGIRLVSVLGMGGLGKTRLALAVATKFPEATFVDLSLLPAATGTARLWQALAEALELETLTEKAVCESLQGRSTLLLLDNAEHLSETTARVLQALLSRCHQARALVTSREPLQLPGEVLFRLQPLSDDDALALFTQRAGLSQPGVELPEAALRSLCQKLEGLPLALELAAARLRVMQIEELEARLIDRFRLLRSDQRRVDRHQTLQATVDGSWEQLSADEKRTLAALSVLVGSWPRSLAQAVAFAPGTDELEVLETLTRLVDKSWLRVTSGSYSLLETLREFLAPHQLPSDRQRLVQFAQTCIPYRYDNEIQSTWLQRLALHRDNLRVALTVANDETAAELAVELGDAFVIQGRTEEGIALYEDLLARLAPQHPQQASLLYFLALLEQARDNPTRAGALLDQARELCERAGDTRLLIRILGNLGVNARLQQDFLRARELFRKTLALLQTSQQGTPSATLIRLGIIEHDLGNLAAARDYLQQAVGLNRHHSNEIGLGVALSKLGYVERDLGEHASAITLWREALSLHRAVGYRQEQGNIALALSRLLDDPQEIATLRTEAHDAFTAIQDQEGLTRLNGT